MYENFISPNAHSTNIQRGLIGQTKQKGCSRLPTLPACPVGPAGVVPGTSWVPKMAYEAKITLRIKITAIMIYRDCEIAPFVFSEKCKCRNRAVLRIRVNTSM